jgi:uncharacterized membrane protein
MLRCCAIVLGVASLAFSGVGFVTAATVYTVTDLGTLGGYYSWPYAINDSGQVAGMSDIST